MSDMQVPGGAGGVGPLQGPGEGPAQKPEIQSDTSRIGETSIDKNASPTDKQAQATRSRSSHVLGKASQKIAQQLGKAKVAIQSALSRAGKALAALRPGGGGAQTSTIAEQETPSKPPEEGGGQTKAAAPPADPRAEALLEETRTEGKPYSVMPSVDNTGYGQIPGGGSRVDSTIDKEKEVDLGYGNIFAGLGYGGVPSESVSEGGEDVTAPDADGYIAVPEGNKGANAPDADGYIAVPEGNKGANAPDADGYIAVPEGDKNANAAGADGYIAVPDRDNTDKEFNPIDKTPSSQDEGHGDIPGQTKRP